MSKLMLPVVPPQQVPAQGQPNEDESDADDHGPADLRAPYGVFIFYIFYMILIWYISMVLGFKTIMFFLS